MTALKQHARRPISRHFRIYVIRINSSNQMKIVKIEDPTNHHSRGSVWRHSSYFGLSFDYILIVEICLREFLNRIYWRLIDTMHAQNSTHFFERRSKIYRWNPMKTLCFVFDVLRVGIVMREAFAPNISQNRWMAIAFSKDGRIPYTEWTDMFPDIRNRSCACVRHSPFNLFW